jgi:hypothetical protein
MKILLSVMLLKCLRLGIVWQYYGLGLREHYYFLEGKLHDWQTKLRRA